MEEEAAGWYGEGDHRAPSGLNESSGPRQEEEHAHDTHLDAHAHAHAPLEASSHSGPTPMDAESQIPLTPSVASQHSGGGQQGALLPPEEVDGFFTSLDSLGRDRSRYYAHTHNPSHAHSLQQYSSHSTHGEYLLCLLTIQCRYYDFVRVKDLSVICTHCNLANWSPIDV